MTLPSAEKAAAPNGAAGFRQSLWAGPIRRWVVAVLLVATTNAALAWWLRAIGHEIYPASGVQVFWSAKLGAGENSQHFSDWYSFLHLVFGIGLFLAISSMKPHWHLASRLLVAVAGSLVWELVENTPFVIALFVDPHEPGAYRGDSVVNSVGDMLFAIAGFFLASRLPVRASLLVAVAVEILVSLVIDDGLVLGTLRVLGVPV